VICFGDEWSFYSRAGPGYRLSVEDAPAETDVEVLPHALKTIMKANGRGIRPGDRSPFSSETTRRLSPGWQVKPIAGGCS
jgi:hypothetical protein